MGCFRSRRIKKKSSVSLNAETGARCLVNYSCYGSVALASFKGPGSRCWANWVFCPATSLTYGNHFVPQFLLRKRGITILAFVCEYLLQLGLMSDSPAARRSTQDHWTVWLQPPSLSEHLHTVGLIQQKKKFRGLLEIHSMLVVQGTHSSRESTFASICPPDLRLVL